MCWGDIKGFELGNLCDCWRYFEFSTDILRFCLWAPKCIGDAASKYASQQQFSASPPPAPFTHDDGARARLQRILTSPLFVRKTVFL